MSQQNIIERLNESRPAFLKAMKSKLLNVDPASKSCKMEFDLGPEYCHSGDIVQGGFVAAMLDAVTAHTVMALSEGEMSVSSLELKVSYLTVTRSGYAVAEGRIDRMGKSICFLSGDLYDRAGAKTATISTTAKLITTVVSPTAIQ